MLTLKYKDQTHQLNIENETTTYEQLRQFIQNNFSQLPEMYRIMCRSYNGDVCVGNQEQFRGIFGERQEGGAVVEIVGDVGDDCQGGKIQTKNNEESINNQQPTQDLKQTEKPQQQPQTSTQTQPQQSQPSQPSFAQPPSSSQHPTQPLPSHSDIKCQQCCQTPIKGIRYKCYVCPNYNICSYCEPTVQHQHALLKIKYDLNKDLRKVKDDDDDDDDDKIQEKEKQKEKEKEKQKEKEKEKGEENGKISGIILANENERKQSKQLKSRFADQLHQLPYVIQPQPVQSPTDNSPTTQSQIKKQPLAQQSPIPTAPTTTTSSSSTGRFDTKKLHKQLLQNQKRQAQLQKLRQQKQAQQALYKKWQGDTKIVHRFIKCQQCMVVNIKGILYKCAVCQSYNLCGRCYSKGKHDHPFLKIRKPLEDKIINVICKMEADKQKQQQKQKEEGKQNISNKQNINGTQKNQPSSSTVTQNKQRQKQNKDKSISEQAKKQLMNRKYSSDVVHPQIQCRECKLMPIKGLRYKCAVCQDYQICQFCEPKTKHDHPFLKIKSTITTKLTITSQFPQTLPKYPSPVPTTIPSSNPTRPQSNPTRPLFRPPVPKTKQQLQQQDRLFRQKQQKARILYQLSQVDTKRWQGNTRIRHPNVQCQQCYVLNMSGTRYKCIVCQDYNMCGDCCFKYKHQHPFVKIRDPLGENWDMEIDAEFQDPSVQEVVREIKEIRIDGVNVPIQPKIISKKKKRLQQQQKRNQANTQSVSSNPPASNQPISNPVSNPVSNPSSNPNYPYNPASNLNSASNPAANVKPSSSPVSNQQSTSNPVTNTVPAFYQPSNLALKNPQVPQKYPSPSIPSVSPTPSFQSPQPPISNPTSSQPPISKPSSSIQSSQKVTHLGITCDQCKKNNFQGIRYKCVVCHDFDLCQTCESHTTHDHPFIKIKKQQHSVCHVSAVVGTYNDQRQGMSSNMRKKRYQLYEQLYQKQKNAHEKAQYLNQQIGIKYGIAYSIVCSMPAATKEQILEEILQKIQ